MTFDLVPRSLEDQQAWLAAHAGAHPAIAAVEGDELVGFGSLSPYRDRPAYSTTVEDSVYVHRDRRGGGVGRLLLDELLALATTHGFHSVIGRIVGGHEASIALHRGVRLRAGGRRARGRTQVRPLARRRPDAEAAVENAYAGERSLQTASPVRTVPATTTLAFTPRRRSSRPVSEFTNRRASRPNRAANFAQPR